MTTDRDRRAEHVARCECGHNKARHDVAGFDGECIAERCRCKAFTERDVFASAARPSTSSASAPAPLGADAASSPEPSKRCTGCGEQKPIEEFYRRHTDGRTRKRLGKCRDCDNSRARARSIARIVRVRGRHRAMAELVTRHKAEFRELLDYFTKVARDEAEQLAATPQGQQVYGPTEPVRLRSGPRREGQEPEDRIDVARCPECVGHHDRGHVCTACGSAPQDLTAKAG